MKLLAMDTSTLVLGVAVYDAESDRVLGEVMTNLHKNHSVRLMPAVDRLLADLELSIEEVGALAVTAGPGSYTGIRIGVTTAKTMAWVRQLPLYSESSLTVLAMNGLNYPGLVVPMFDARRQRAYTGVYRGQRGVPTEVLPQQVMEVSALLEWLREREEPVLFLGDDVTKFRESIQEALGDRAVWGNAADHIPRAAQLAWLCGQKWKAHQPPEHADFTPNYLQITEAEANWLKKRGKAESNE
ncbi:tRNA threonylcarbamoyladenosine biosynthesis protein TsaB [Laceyella sediminis]|uniref:tRNA threonylcarbamoyladenosine biosynthesis protein TsaB n=1 Tax=Laceyella sediminis TaxID=573074 RepID=A0ABX5EJW1_9BACL|nr:tRNA (adenosine(37)-N6)-threonylcarbamoyltransferase complex dimerization subunit type 1 TsaB [Laceyella sediminis]PRZ11961.1 tRNA threonylcarbamoyladenosine biosynthesis protein TsaB [Laceyella sediminis]